MAKKNIDAEPYLRPEPKVYTPYPMEVLQTTQLRCRLAHLFHVEAVDPTILDPTWVSEVIEIGSELEQREAI